MKKLCLLIEALLFTGLLYGQSISASKIHEFLNSQNVKSISDYLTTKDFVYQNDILIKKGAYGYEALSFFKNDELFGIAYQPAGEFYSSYKEKLLTPDLKYVYQGGGNEYYENNDMRIGVNNTTKMITFFKALK